MSGEKARSKERREYPTGSENQRDLISELALPAYISERAVGRTNPRARLARPKWECCGTPRTERMSSCDRAERLAWCAHVVRHIAVLGRSERSDDAREVNGCFVTMYIV